MFTGSVGIRFEIIGVSVREIRSGENIHGAVSDSATHFTFIYSAIIGRFEYTNRSEAQVRAN